MISKSKNLGLNDDFLNSRDLVDYYIYNYHAGKISLYLFL